MCYVVLCNIVLFITPLCCVILHDTDHGKDGGDGDGDGDASNTILTSTVM